MFEQRQPLGVDAIALAGGVADQVAAQDVRPGEPAGDRDGRDGCLVAEFEDAADVVQDRRGADQVAVERRVRKRAA